MYCRSFQKIFQFPAARGVAELSQGFGFYLPYAFASYLKFLTHLLKCALPPVDQTVTQYDNTLFTVAESVQHLSQHLL